MNKRKVDELIPKAVEVLKKSKIADEHGIIDKTYRGQISTLGAAITNGSLISAIAFFSDNGSASIDRKNLIEALKMLIVGDDTTTLFDYVKSRGRDKEAEVKEEILNAAIALKLAMNLYELKG